MSNIVSFPSQVDGYVHIVRGSDGFYVVYTGPDADPSEIILGGPHAKETTAQAEARFVATDFGARLLHHGWGHS